MEQIKKHFLEAYKEKDRMVKSIDPMDEKVQPDAQIAYAIDHALRTIEKEVEAGKGSRELSLVKTKLQEAEFWLFKT